MEKCCAIRRAHFDRFATSVFVWFLRCCSCCLRIEHPWNPWNPWNPYYGAFIELSDGQCR